MRMRIAGIAGSRLTAVPDFVRMATARFAAEAPGKSTVLAFPEQQPLVAVVIADGRRPPVRFWRGADGSFAILDGEIYDFGDGSAVKSSEVPADEHARRLFEIYRRSGANGIARLDAAAAMIVFDASRRELRVFRDVSGVITTFHATVDGDAIFASEMATLLDAGVPKRIDRQTVDYYLSKGYAPAPWTFIEGVRKIPPAHVLTMKPGTPPSTTRYFRQVTSPKLRLDTGQRHERMRELFVQSLRRRHDTEQPNAVLLSAGIDSILVLGSLVKLVGAPARAFTFRYADYEGRFNEEEPARRLADYLGVKHEVIPYGPADIADGLSTILKEYGEPLAWGLHSFMLRQLARPDVRVILTGLEPEFNLRPIDVAAIRYRSLPAPVRWALRTGWKVARPALPKYQRAIGSIFRTERNGLPPQFVHSSILCEEARRAVYVDPEWARSGSQASERLFLSALDEIRDEDPYDQARLLDDRYLNGDAPMFWTSVWGRTYDLVMRHPHYDRDWRDFFYSLPADRPAKSHFREFAATFLPHEFAYLPKLPQEVPIGDWFRGPLQDFARQRLAPDALPTNLFRPAMVQRLLAEHIEGRADHAWRIWALISLSSWASMLEL
jgi:asparagine synthase (glutamine-hydrolysing)